MLARIIFIITFFVVIALPSVSQISIIPEPVSLKQKEGVYTFKDKITINVPESLRGIAGWLKEKLAVTGLPFSIVGGTEKADM